MILVTGHKGFIGSFLVHRLIQLNYRIRCFEWGDKLNLEGVKTVMHLGAISSTTEKDVEKVLTQNYDFSVELLNLCIENKIDLQYASSASVYGLNKEFKENSPVDPRTPYAWSKYLFEREANKAINQKVGITIQGFRYFNVWAEFGEDHKLNQSSPYFKFLKEARETKYITLFKNSENYKRDFIHVYQIVDLHLKFLKINESGIWNFGTGKTKSFLEVARQVHSLYPCQFKTIKIPKQLVNSYQEYTCADMTKTHDTLKLWRSYEENINYGPSWSW
jgi:ADP-L-glycero-D-manno-heptose 6-epimerase